MKQRQAELEALVADLAKQFVGAVEEARVLTIEDCASYVERASPCHCRAMTAKAIRGLIAGGPSPTSGVAGERSE